jgi:FkbM family methyltransferase
MIRQLTRLLRGDRGTARANEGRLPLLLAYLRLVAQQRFSSSRRRRAGATELTFDGQRLAAFDPVTLRFSIDEIFIDRSYACPLPPSPTIVDCGANVGIATGFFVAEHPGARVIAIEPDPAAFELLSRNIRSNRWPNVTAHNAAAADKDGTTVFYRDPSKPGSLLGSTTRRVLGEELTVRTVRLSQLIPDSVDLLKLDVEGAESEILDELVAAGALARIGAIIVEFHHDPDRPALLADFLQRLGDAGFSCELRSVGPGAAPAGESAQDVLIYATRRSA